MKDREKDQKILNGSGNRRTIVLLELERNILKQKWRKLSASQTKHSSNRRLRFLSDPTKKSKSKMEHQKVWVPDPVNGFVLGVIQDISSDEVTVTTVADRKTVKVSYDSIYPSGELINRDFDDNCKACFFEIRTNH